MNSKPDAPAPEPKKIDQAQVAEARQRAAKRPRGIMSGSASLLTSGYGGYGQKDTLG